MSLSPFYRLGDRNFVNITEKIIDLAKEFVQIFPKLLQPEQTFWLSQYYHYLGENPGCLNNPPPPNTDFATFQANLSHHHEFRQ